MRFVKWRVLVRIALVLFVLGAFGFWWVFRETIRSYVMRPENKADWAGSIERKPPGFDPKKKPSRAWLDPNHEAPELTSYYEYAASAIGGQKTYYLIYLPPGYGEAANARRRYPVVYWLHGHHAAPRYAQPFFEALDAAIKAKACPAMIAVLPEGLDNSWWVDSEDGSQPVESVVVKDLIPEVDRTWRTISERRGRAIEGFSMGGWGAAHLAFKYPDLFCAVTMLSAPLHTHVSFPQFKRIFNRVPESYYAEEPVLMAKRSAAKLRDGQMRVRILAGDQERNATFVPLFDRQLTEWGIVHEVKLLAGVGHDDDDAYRVLGTEGFGFYARVFADAQ